MKQLFGIKYSDGLVFEIGPVTRLEANAQLEFAKQMSEAGNTEFDGATLVVRPVEPEWIEVTD